MMLAASSATAAGTCFTAFGGSVHYQFAEPANSFKTPGIINVSGVTFGALSSCAGLTHWPLVGTAVSNGKTTVLAFRAMTVAATGCGAVDEIVSLNSTTLSGALQLHNDRNNFSNTTTLVQAACVSVPLLTAESVTPEAQGKRPDQTGNIAAK